MISYFTIISILFVTGLGIMCTIDLQKSFKTWMCTASTYEVTEYNPDVTSRIADLEYAVNKLEKQGQVRERYINELESEVRQLKENAKNSHEILKTIREKDIPKDCEEIFLKGQKEDGVYLISPDGRCPFKVFCDMKNGGWTLMQFAEKN